MLLKVSTSDDREYRAWCTRRFSMLLLSRLEAMFETEAVEPQQVVPQEARKEVAQLKHRGSLSETDFTKPYEAEPTEYPLGEDGLLLTRLSYKTGDNGRVSLLLGSKQGKSFTLGMDNKLRHNFYELLSRACHRAQWFEEKDRGGNPVVH